MHQAKQQKQSKSSATDKRKQKSKSYATVADIQSWSPRFGDEFVQLLQYPQKELP